MRDCKTLSVFERKIPLTFRVHISTRVKTMHNAWNFSPNFFKVPPIIKNFETPAFQEKHINDSMFIKNLMK
jgi:hypothetical protein